MAATVDAPGNQNAEPRRVMVWDLPTRLFHWLLVFFVLVSFTTAEIGGNAMAYHQKSGYIILALLLFRFVWGFFGSHESRFSTFLRGPAVVYRYAKEMLNRTSPGHLGHNPLGGWSIAAMLLVLLVQAGTGLFANDDIVTEGPLAHLVSKASSDGLTRLHRLNSDLIVILVTIHIAAVLFYLLIKRDNLITPMFTGTKKWAGSVDSARGNFWIALGLALFSALAVYLLVH